MESSAFLQRLSDDDLQRAQQTGVIPAPLIDAERQRRVQLRTAAEGADMRPEFHQGLGAPVYGNV